MATIQKAVFGKIDPEKVAKFKAQQLKSILRSRDKGHRDFRDMTDAQCEQMAENLTRMWVGSMSGKMMFREVNWEAV